ncbi:gp78 [Mycobacterium phage Bxb1]|uniref:Uncharacterized protein n=1 Tax=Mycobacterium phage Bxb1 TaxID=2902907 RepID=Q9B043_BPMB1|nr:gp78 [Mycobacterium phage Bxb1]AAG59783.1 hypothetical protein PBI_BXB1_78 [Mycobacterium phage Bxb1]
MTVEPKHSKITLTRMAACEALGLHYWSGHAVRGCVWAVDDNQQAYTVLIRTKGKMLSASVATLYDKIVGYSTVRNPDVPPGHKGALVRTPRTELAVREENEPTPFVVTDETRTLFAMDAA